MTTYACRCGRLTIQADVPMENVVCDRCPLPAHEGGLLATVDEWFHRHNRKAGNWFWYLYRPLCNLRDWRLRRHGF